MVVLDFVRHAQGYHNLGRHNWNMRDPALTDLGEQQCADLQAAYPYHDRVRLLVASPLRRTLHTALLSFAPTAARGVPVIGMPELQEISGLPSDTGRERGEIAPLFAPGAVDLSRVHPAWYHKGDGSPYTYTAEALVARARSARRQLRDLAAAHGLGPDDRIAVVTHGGFLHYLTEDHEGMSREKGTGWTNTEWRSYEFADATGADDNATVRETPASWARRRGTETPLSEHQRAELEAVSHTMLRDEIGEHLKGTSLVQYPADYATSRRQGEEAEAKAKAAGASL